MIINRDIRAHGSIPFLIQSEIWDSYFKGRVASSRESSVLEISLSQVFLECYIREGLRINYQKSKLVSFSLKKWRKKSHIVLIDTEW